MMDSREMGVFTPNFCLSIFLDSVVLMLSQTSFALLGSSLLPPLSVSLVFV